MRLLLVLQKNEIKKKIEKYFEGEQLEECFTKTSLTLDVSVACVHTWSTPFSLESTKLLHWEGP